MNIFFAVWLEMGVEGFDIFYFTFVGHEEGDKLGFILSAMGLFPLIILIILITLLYLHRELVHLYTCIGFIINELTNKVLKKWIQKPRPEGK